MQQNWKPEGFRALTPYLVATNAAGLIDFCRDVFQAELKARHDVEGGSAIMHSELRLGDSILELADGNEKYPPKPMELHLYVPDVARVFERAVRAGARIAHDLTSQDYGDQEAGIEDPSGNRWYIATHQTGAGYRPEGLHDLTPFLHVESSTGFLRFVEKAFGGKQMALHQSPEGRVLHAVVQIADSPLELSDTHGAYGPSAANLHYYVPDADATYRSALAAGASSALEPYDAPYGDRSSGVLDPFGNTWWISTMTDRRKE